MRCLTWPHIPRKFTRQSHLAFAIGLNRLFYRLGSSARLGSIPIARSTSSASAGQPHHFVEFRSGGSSFS
jgi:hypothetical protein